MLKKMTVKDLLNEMEMENIPYDHDYSIVERDSIINKAVLLILLRLDDIETKLNKLEKGE